MVCLLPPCAHTVRSEINCTLANLRHCYHTNALAFKPISQRLPIDVVFCAVALLLSSFMCSLHKHFRSKFSGPFGQNRSSYGHAYCPVAKKICNYSQERKLPDKLSYTKNDQVCCFVSMAIYVWNNIVLWLERIFPTRDALSDHRNFRYASTTSTHKAVS